MLLLAALVTANLQTQNCGSGLFVLAAAAGLFVLAAAGLSSIKPHSLLLIPMKKEQQNNSDDKQNQNSAENAFTG